MSIKVEHLNKRFGSFVAVDDVSFEVPQGELVGLLGPSGSGKSTILRLIAGLEMADTGTVYLDGTAVNHLRPRERQVGFVFQHYALFRHMTVADNIAFGLSVQGVPQEMQDERVRELLRLVGLDGLARRYPAQLSGGQRQRVALARALAPKPRLLLLDEPFGAVDAKVRSELRRWLRRLHDELHVTSLFVTHDQDEAFDVADRLVLMNRSKVEQVGTPRDVLETPASEFVARFFGDVNIFAARAGEGVVSVGPLRVPVQGVVDGQDVSLVIRSYDVKLWRDDAGLAKLQRITPLGDRVRIEAYVEGAGPLLAHFPRRSSLLKGFELGCRLAIEVTFARAYPRSLTEAKKV